MKRILTFLSLTLSLSTAFAAEPPKKVLINQFVSHPALNKTVEGIVGGLKQEGYKAGVNLDLRVESAQANSALASQISAKFVSQNPDVVVGIATLSAQSFSKYARSGQTKLIFSSVTSPIEAKLIQSINTPGNNTSGVSNFIALEPQLELFKEIQPNLKRLGFLYNASEANSLSLIQQLKPLCAKLNIILVLQSANKTSEMAQAATKLANQVDAIFISNDSTALSALTPIIRAANQARVPVYVSDTDAVALGALAALGPNQYQVGIQTAKLIARVLKGEAISGMPVEFPKQRALYLNQTAAEKLGITFNPALKKKANQLVKMS